jgi:hypothetical protein
MISDMNGRFARWVTFQVMPSQRVSRINAAGHDGLMQAAP